MLIYATFGYSIDFTLILHAFISICISILAIVNFLAHNDITITYYLQVNSLWLKSSIASKWARKNL